MKKNVLIAGGSGAIGSGIAELLRNNGFEVFILSRKAKADKRFILWNVDSKILEWPKDKKIDLLINLCGSGIAESRWTSKRKKELESSRIDTTNFLFEQLKETKIEHYIGASGITAFPFDQEKIFIESDTIEGGYLQNLVKIWEEAHQQFNAIAKVSIIRVAPVIKLDSGLIVKMSRIINKGIGSYLGNGQQLSPWVHHKDLSRMVLHIFENELAGIYHTNSSNCTNKELTDAIANIKKKKIWLPKVPKFVLRIMLGEMAEMMLGSLHTSSEKIENTGFKFEYKNVFEAVEEIYN